MTPMHHASTCDIVSWGLGMSDIEIIDTNAGNIQNYGVCGFKNLKQEGYRRKIEWLKARSAEGIKIQTLYSTDDGTQGMIEYIPGEYSWRPVEAGGYTFIHCIFVGFKKAYKGQGYGSLLLNKCLEDARKGNRHGVAVVTRKGTWMAGKELFVKNGFSLVGSAPPDFSLLVMKFNDDAPTPKFRENLGRGLEQYGRGLTIFRSDQCPAIEKAMGDICQTAEKVYGIKPAIVEMTDYRDAQNSPCAFGSFCIVYNGRLVATNPISHTRFKNIMNKEARKRAA
jgi:GNAT superfamily N-acetyltransferase